MSTSQRSAILLVEDEQQLRALIASVLDMGGFRPICCSSAEEGIEAFHSRRDEIVLVITDLGLPKLGGLDLIKEVRRCSTSVKIIGISGFGGSIAAKKVLDAGADRFVMKPFGTEAILDIVTSTLS